METNETDNQKKATSAKAKIILGILLLIILVIWHSWIFIAFILLSASLWYMWAKTNWSQNKKFLATIGTIFLFLIVIVISISEPENKSTQQVSAPQEQPKATEAAATVPLPPSQKEDLIKLAIAQPEKDGTEVTQSTFKIEGSVASPNVIVKISKNVSVDNEKVVPVDPNGNFNLTVDLQNEGNTFYVVAKNGDEEAKKIISIIRKMSKEESEAKLKAEAKAIPYKELFRNIDTHKGDAIHYKGKVIQVIGDGKAFSTMRVDVTRGAYDIWDDTVLVGNIDPDNNKILEGDIIEFWGTVLGEESYQTVLGATVSLPSLAASIIELVK